MFILRILIGIVKMIQNIIFDITRDKLIDETEKYDFLYNKSV